MPGSVTYVAVRKPKHLQSNIKLEFYRNHKRRSKIHKNGDMSFLQIINTFIAYRIL